MSISENQTLSKPNLNGSFRTPQIARVISNTTNWKGVPKIGFTRSIEERIADRRRDTENAFTRRKALNY